jgi:hypothetical protein
LIDWKQVEQLFNLVKSGAMSKAEGHGFKIYSMGVNNPVIRIDVRKDT